MSAKLQIFLGAESCVGVGTIPCSAALFTYSSLFLEETWAMQRVLQAEEETPTLAYISSLKEHTHHCSPGIMFRGKEKVDMKDYTHTTAFSTFPHSYTIRSWHFLVLVVKYTLRTCIIKQCTFQKHKANYVECHIQYMIPRMAKCEVLILPQWAEKQAARSTSSTSMIANPSHHEWVWLP